MKTKVFISWSGNTSRRIGEALRDWIPAVLQLVEPYFTPNDIEKGARWSNDIAKELQTSQVGIFCLTKENLNSKWMLFEAGAISKNLQSSFVCPILFDVEFSDFDGPLTQFQMSKFSKPEILRLVKTINSAGDGEKLSDKILESVFEKWWGELESTIRQILKAPKNETHEIRPDREILDEILSITRNINKTFSQPTASGKSIYEKLIAFEYHMGNDLKASVSALFGLVNILIVDTDDSSKQEAILRLRGEISKLDSKIDFLKSQLNTFYLYDIPKL